MEACKKFTGTSIQNGIVYGTIADNLDRHHKLLIMKNYYGMVIKKKKKKCYPTFVACINN